MKQHSYQISIMLVSCSWSLGSGQLDNEALSSSFPEADCAEVKICSQPIELPPLDAGSYYYHCVTMLSFLGRRWSMHYVPSS